MSFINELLIVKLLDDIIEWAYNGIITAERKQQVHQKLKSLEQLNTVQLNIPNIGNHSRVVHVTKSNEIGISTPNEIAEILRHDFTFQQIQKKVGFVFIHSKIYCFCLYAEFYGKDEQLVPEY